MPRMLMRYIFRQHLSNYCDNANHQMRSNGRKLILDKPERSFMKKSFSYRGASAWNALPNEILDIHDRLSMRSFKIKLDNHLHVGQVSEHTL